MKNKGSKQKRNQQISVSQRLELVASRRNQGRSTRAIAAEIGVDEGTIRRDLKVLELPPDDLAAIAKGEPAERYLRAAEAERAAREERARIEQAEEQRRAHLAQIAAGIAQRLGEETAAGCHSESLKQAIVEWFLAKQLPFGDPELILNTAELKSWNAGDLQQLPCQDSVAVLQLCESLQGPPPIDNWERIDFLSKVLVRALVKLAPEREIRDRAIQKARREIINLTQNQKPSRLFQSQFDTVPLPVGDISKSAQGQEGEVGPGTFHPAVRQTGDQHSVQIAFGSGPFARGHHSSSQPYGEGWASRPWKRRTTAPSRIPFRDPWK